MRPYQVAIVGVAQSGKSSIGNCLLRKGLPSSLPEASVSALPVADLRTTTTLTQVCYGAIPEIEAHYFEGGIESASRDEFLCAATDALDLPNFSGNGDLHGFILRLPSEICHNGVCLIDTPGVFEDDWRREIAGQVLARSHAAIVVHRPETLDSSDSSPWSLLRSDLERAAVRTFHVINFDPEHQPYGAVKKLARRVLVPPWEGKDIELDACLSKHQVHLVAVSLATKGLEIGNEQMVVDSGFRHFEDRLSSFLNSEIRRSQSNHFRRNRIRPAVLSDIRSLQELHDNAANIEKLTHSLRAGRIIPFVGAGLSAPFGYPTWSTFLRRVTNSESIKSEVVEQLRFNHFEEAAELIFQERGDLAFNQALEDTFAKRPDLGISRSAAAFLIPDLFVGPILTTNYDRLIETVFAARGIGIESIVGGHAELAMKRFSEQRRFLLKIHGDCDSRRERVLRREEYKAVYECSDALPSLLRCLFGAHPHLFLGCSLGPDRVIAILKSVRSSGVPHFAIIPESPEGDPDTQRSRRKALDEAGVYPIWYPTGQHGSVASVLEYLLYHRGD